MRLRRQPRAGETGRDQGPVLHDDVRIGRGTVVRGAVLEKNAEVPSGATTGVAPARDAEPHTVSKGGATALGEARRVSLAGTGGQ